MTSTFLLFLLIITGFSTSEMPSSISNSEGPKRPPLPIKAPASRSLLSPKYKPDTAIIASLDGTVYLVESNSGKVYWSFSSGPPLSSSHQALPDPNIDDAYASGLGEQPGTKSDLNDNYFVDIGDDWNLYVHSKHFGRTKLPMTVEEYINSTPHISEDGGVTLGSKKTSVFLVDAKTGKVIHTYGSPHAQSISGLTTNGENLVLSKQDVEELMKSSSGNVNTVEPLFVTRTDYALQSFAPNSEKVLWNMTVSEIGAAFLCQGIADTFSDVSFDKKDKLGLEYQGDFEMPLPCRTKAIVYRTRDNNILQSNLEFSGFDKLPEASPPDSEVLPLPSPYIQNPVVLNMPNENKRPLDKLDNSCETENSCLVTIDDIDRQNETVTFTEYIYGGPVSYIVPVSYISLLFLILVVSWYYLMGRKHSKSDKQLTDSSGKQSVAAKRKKSRRAGNNKNISTINRHDKHISSEIDDVEPFELTGVQRNDRGSLFDLTKAVEDNDGRWVGKLFVSNTEIAMGSNGTIVFEGIYDGRPVAVKRLVQAHNDVAFKEIQNLIASDQHPNIVRWYGVEYDLDFVYLSLERCTCSLNDLIQQYSETYLDPIFVENLASNPMKECTICIGNSKGLNKDIELWKANGYPSSQLLKLMRDVVSGLTHLHELGIIHRDLKPQNVLIIGERYICAKLSDMGISKRLLGDMSSLGHHATGYGSSGWQAPEQLLHGRQTRAMDLFSLGCVLFFCITGGKHPFGDRLERDINIVKNRVDLFLVEQIPEAVDLISHLLDPNPDSRPKALEVLQHPLFWNSEMRLSFLRDTSDRIELEDRENESELLIELEKVAPLALGGKWDEKMEAAFITNIGRYRRYKFDSTRDLLRVIRNKFNHYRELPKEIQEILGPIPEGFSEYFASRFPKLLIEVYKVIYRYCRDEECFWKYFKSHLI